MQLNNSALNTVVINGQIGGNTYTQAVSATSTTTASFLKAAQTAKSVLSSSATSVIKALTKTMTAVDTIAVSLIKQVGKIMFKGINYFLNSQDFTNVEWTKANSSIVANTTTAPDNLTTASKLVDNATLNQHMVYKSRSGSNETLTFSVYAKAAERTKVFLQLSNFLNETAQATFDLSAGTAGSAGVNGTDYVSKSTSIISVGNGWYRCTLTATKKAVNTTNIPTISTTDASGNPTYTGDGVSGIYIWGAQLEKNSTVGPYMYTNGTAALPAAISLIKQIGKIIFKGYNLLTYSEDYSNVAYIKTNTTVTSDAATSPIGTVTADKLIGNNGVTGRKSSYQTYGSFLAGNTYTFSVYLQQAGYTTASIWCDTLNTSPGAYYGASSLINLAAGTVGGTQTTITSIGSGWYRCQTTFTITVSGSYPLQVSLGDPNGVGTPAGDGVSGIYVWGAQLEKQSAVGPYVQTTSSAYLPAVITLTKLANKLMNVTSTVINSILKYTGKIVLAADVTASVIIRAVNRLVVLLAYSSSTSSIKRQTNKIITATQASVATIVRSIGKLLNVTSSTTSTIVRALTKTLSVTVTEVVSIIKSAILSILVTSINTTSMFKDINKFISAAVTSVSTIVSAKFFFKALTVVSTSTVTIVNSLIKLLTISVNCGIIIGKSINKYFNILSNVIVSLLANVISFISFDPSKLIYAASKVREISKVRFDTIFTATQKLREATIVKFRTIFINKDNQV